MFWIGFVGGALALLFALIQLGRLRPLSLGGPPAQGLAQALSKGTNAYLKRQLSLSGAVFLAVFGLLLGLSFLGLLDRMAAFAFLSGGGCGLLAGVVGAKVTATAGPRAAEEAAGRLDRGMNAALRASCILSFTAVGLGLCHVTAWIFILRYGFDYSPADIAWTMPFFGLGAALASLLLRMGGVFFRASHMAAEIVDRDMGLPPDSPRNPAAIAQRVGYGVGSAAGMVSGLHSSMELALLGAFSLGCAAFSADNMVWNAMLFPLAIVVAGTLCSLIGFFTVPPKERGDRYSLPWSLRIGELVASALTAALCFPIAYFLLGSWQLCWSVIAGLAAGYAVKLLGEYFTADTYKPARSLAETAETGTVSALTGALTLGLTSALLPALGLLAALAIAFLTAGGSADFSRGIYGVALAAVGMLSVSGISLAAALTGPVGDNAATALSLIDDDEIPRRRADNLAAIGAAAANGWQCRSAVSTTLAALTALLCLGNVYQLAFHLELGALEPTLFLGAFLGVLLLLGFSGLLLFALRRSSMAGVLLVRRWLQDSDGLLEGTEEPDYAAFLSRCAGRSGLCSLPAFLILLLFPAAVTVVLGPRGMMGALGCILVLSLALELFFTLSGGVLSGARRYVDSGKRGGRGSDCHRAALQGERILAPLSQALGPALAALVRLTACLSLVCYALARLGL